MFVASRAQDLERAKCFIRGAKVALLTERGCPLLDHSYKYLAALRPAKSNDSEFSEWPTLRRCVSNGQEH